MCLGGDHMYDYTKLLFLLLFFFLDWKCVINVFVLTTSGALELDTKGFETSSW